MILPEPHQEGKTSYPTLDLIHKNQSVPQGEFEIIRGESFSHYPQGQVPPKGATIPPKMNLSLSSPQDELEILVRVTPTVKSQKQTKLLENFILTFEEINRVTDRLPDHEYRPTRHPAGPARISNLKPSRVHSQEHNSMKSPARQRNVQTIITLSILTPAAMMRLSSAAKRSVQQAVVLSHVAAESYHEGYKGTQWEVWLARLSNYFAYVKPRPASMNEVEANLNE